MIGDTLAKALASVGLTPSRVERWLGPCRCRERQERLNSLEAWARRVAAGKLERAREYLDGIMGK